MHPSRPFTPGERHFVAMVLGALPSIYVGFNAGFFAADIGAVPDLVSILFRSIVCAAPVTILTVLTPRRWLLPSLIYGYGFYCGYTFTDTIGAAVTTLVAIPLAAWTRHRPDTLLAPTHPELLALYGVALWSAAFISFVRCRYSRLNEST